MRIKWPVAALCLVSLMTVLLVGCGLDRRSTVIGSGVVTAGSGRSDQPTTSTPSAEGPNGGTVTPTTEGPTDGTPTPTADDSRDSTPTPRVGDATASPAGCGPIPGQGSDRGARVVPTPVRDDEAELDVDGQAGDGRSVYIAEVQLSRKPGFVAVCAPDDRLLGFHPIARSNNERSVRVRLDNPITATTNLLVLLYADNGDGHFDWATDPHVSGDEDDITDIEVERLTYRYAD